MGMPSSVKHTDPTGLFSNDDFNQSLFCRLFPLLCNPSELPFDDEDDAPRPHCPLPGLPGNLPENWMPEPGTRLGPQVCDNCEEPEKLVATASLNAPKVPNSLSVGVAQIQVKVPVALAL